MPQREDIIESMARTMFVSAYADFIDRCHEDKEDVSDLDQAGAGQDWMNHSPETTEAARKAAEDLAMRIERTNNRNLEQLFDRATAACRIGLAPYCRKHTAEAFGSDLAMMALGTGVSWFDDHTKFELEVPHIEFYIFDRDDLK